MLLSCHLFFQSNGGSRLNVSWPSGVLMWATMCPLTLKCISEASFWNFNKYCFSPSGYIAGSGTIISSTSDSKTHLYPHLIFYIIYNTKLYNTMQYNTILTIQYNPSQFKQVLIYITVLLYYTILFFYFIALHCIAFYCIVFKFIVMYCFV